MNYEFIQGKSTEAEFTAKVDGVYAAAQASPTRRRPGRVLKSEDHALNQSDRDRIFTAAADNNRNFVIAGWALRKHLDFVSTFSFSCSHPDRELAYYVEALVEEASEPENFDIRRRCSRQDHVRIDEALRTTAGDMLIERVVTGHVQAIEGDRIRNPPKKFNGGRKWINGVSQNAAGANELYSIWQRTASGGMKFEKILTAEQVMHFGYFPRHDTARGISLYAPALDNFFQANRSVQLAQAKQVLSQLFGLKLKKSDPSTKPIDMSKGPFVVEVGTEEDAEFLYDKTPSKEFDSFLRHVIGIAIKCVDLPYNFYDEAHTNFFGSRAALNLYLLSCLAKRRGVTWLLNLWLRWRLNFEISRGRFSLPKSTDLASFCRRYCEWIPAGIQWFNPLQEAKAAALLIKLRLRSRSELRREIVGDSWVSLQDTLDAENRRILGGIESTLSDPTAQEIFDILVANASMEGNENNSIRLDEILDSIQTAA